MSLSNETRERIEKFAKVQSRYYLDAAEMTYLEKLRTKAGQTGKKLNRKLAKFKIGSEQAREAQNDLTLYMSDYIGDLTAKGMSESEAYEKAEKELAANATPGLGADINGMGEDIGERFQRYYENREPADYESMGLFVGGFSALGMAVGALAGYIQGGGRPGFLDGGWIDTLVGFIAGMFIGAGLALIASAIRIKRR